MFQSEKKNAKNSIRIEFRRSEIKFSSAGIMNSTVNLFNLNKISLNERFLNKAYLSQNEIEYYTASPKYLFFN
jgi:hypothetical protein